MRAAVNANLKALMRLGNRATEASIELLGCSIYLICGRRPNGIGYREFRNRYVRQIIGEASFPDGFSANQQLPASFGVRLDERVVEYPWVLSRLARYEEGSRVLDAGSTLNFEMILRHSAVKRHKLVITTLAPEENCFWDLGVSYLYDDLRSLPWKDDWFDTVTCVSTIEHVGMDNSAATRQNDFHEDRPRDYALAIRELYRVLKPGGTLLLTVPFGKYEHHGWFQQFDSRMLTALISDFGPKNVTKTIFRYTKFGWKTATEQECSDLSFSGVLRNKHALPEDRVPGYPPDYAAAARAVACIELQK